jgi:hypothetical protein
MYSVKLSSIIAPMRNCATTTRGDWLFNNKQERDKWLKETHDLSVRTIKTYDEIVFKSEQHYLMFMLKWA